MATAALMPTTAIRGGTVMSVNRTCSLMSAFLLAAVAVMGSSAAFAQNRQFSFAYDQPKSSGYGVGAEMFNKKLMELSNRVFAQVEEEKTGSGGGFELRRGPFYLCS